MANSSRHNFSAIPFAKLALGNLIACVLIALILWPMLKVGFGTVLIHSVAIGMLSLLLIHTGSKLLSVRGWFSGRFGIVNHIGLILVLSLVAYVVGSLIARVLLGLPLFPLLPFSHTARVGFEQESIVTTIVAAFVLSAAFFAYSNYVSAKLDAALAREQVSNAQLAMLRAQVEPHMLFNTLANLRALIATDPPRAQQMLDQLIDFLRATLASSQNPNVSLRQEFAMLDDYLSLMKIRLGDRLCYELELPPALQEYRVPSLLLQPLVENAIRHGVEPSREGGCIGVRARVYQDQIHLCVHDTGVGISDAAREKVLIRSQANRKVGVGNQGTATESYGTDSRGLGLNQLADRLAVAYGQNASFLVGSATDARSGTQVDIYLPLQGNHPQ